MKEDTRITALKDYFLECPFIEDDIYTDYLPKESTEYAIYPTGDNNEGVITSFIGGDAIMGFSFIFACQFNYSTLNTLNNIKNCGFFENLQNWIKSNNKKGVFPDVENPQRIEILKTGSLSIVDPSQQRAEYQMICRLVFYKEEKR